MGTITIINGNTNDKDNTKVFMVKGQDGVSPTIDLQESTGKLKISVTDYDGTEEAIISDPIVSVTKTDGVATISVTDKDGTRSTTISDGADLTDGAVPQGAVIGFDGENIPDGYEEVNSNLATVEVKSTEPNADVWIKRGKNLYNPKTAFHYGVNLQDIRLRYNEINTGDTYTFTTGHTYTLIETFDSSHQVVRVIGNSESSTSVSITIASGEVYFECSFYSGYNNVDVSTYDFTGVQLESGLTPTEYEPYIRKEVLTKNNNGFFETFYSEPIREIKQMRIVNVTPDSNGFINIGLGLNNVIIGVSNVTEEGFYTPFQNILDNRLTIKCETYNRQPITTQVSLFVYYFEV